MVQPAALFGAVRPLILGCCPVTGRILRLRRNGCRYKNRQGNREQLGSLHWDPLLRRLSAALVQFDHVAIRIAHEDSLRPGPEADGAAAQRDTGRLEPLLRGDDVGA
jgi:hypothetical protein